MSLLGTVHAGAGHSERGVDAGQCRSPDCGYKGKWFQMDEIHKRLRNDHPDFPARQPHSELANVNLNDLNQTIPHFFC